MPRAARRESASGIYHVLTRGSGQQLIFEDDSDRRVFINLMVKVFGKYEVEVFAWCLMENHVHVLLRAAFDDLSRSIAEIKSRYAQYFNERHERSGSLFQSRFQSEPVEDDTYFLTVLRYIHRNPVKAGICNDCLYPWSSYAEYVGEPHLASTSLALGMTGGVAAFEAFHRIESENAEVLEVVHPQRKIRDEAALSIAIERFGDEGIGRIKTLPKEERDNALRILKSQGISIRQIQRITGVSLGAISQA